MTLRADNEARTTVEIITEFLAAIFEGTQEPKFFQTLANDAGDADEAPNKKSILTDQVASIARFVAKYDRNRRGLFFCVSTIAKGSSTRNKDNCSEITVAYIDLDFRSIAEDEPAVRSVADTFPVPPSIVVNSGGGLHLYWLLKEPLPAQEYRERLEALNKKLASILAGDAAATDVCRLMRLPGTTNSKYGSQRKVVVEKLDAAFRYDFDELEEAVDGLRPLLTAKEAKPVGVAIRGSKKPSQTQAPDNPFLKVAEEQGWKPPLDVAQALASMAYPGNVHDTQIRVCASLMKAGEEEDNVVQLVLEATMNAKGVDFAKWDWPAEEKAIRGHCRSAVAKFVMPGNAPAITPDYAVSRETPKTTVSVSGKGTPIGAENVVQFERKQRKAAQNSAQAAHIALAKAVLGVLENRRYRLLFTETGPYAYEAGLWTLRDDRDLTGWLNAYLEDGAQDMKLESKIRLINEARAWIIRQPSLQGRGTLFDRHGKVPTASGLICPIKGTIEPATPEHYCTWQIPHAYDPAAVCPNWLQLIADVFADRPETVRREYIDLIQEWMGMGLVDAKAKALAKALALIGGSNSGKSTLLDVIGGLYGSSVISVPIDELENSHGTTPFVQRLAWVLPEAFDASKWHVPSKVKALISGEPVQINVKGGRIFSHAYTGPVAWGANADPQFKEATKAITNRLLLIQCKREFDEDDPVGVALAARDAGFSTPAELVLATEMSGVLAWAMEGLRRAKSRGYFLIPAEGRSALDAIQRDSNIARGFVDDCIDFDPDGMIGTADFTASFTSWWGVEKGGRNTPGSESIGRALKALAEPRIAIDRVGLRRTVTRYYAGIKFNDDGMKYWLDALNREAFNYEGFKAGMSTQDEGPNRDIPAEWNRKSAVLAMRVAHMKSMTVRHDRFPGDVPLKKAVIGENGHRSLTGHGNGHDEKDEPLQEDIPF
jgi:phage/plasmid-associated DNA primase